MPYGQTLKLGTYVGDTPILATLSPVDRTYSINTKKIQRNATLASGRTVSNYIASTHDITIDYKKLGYNRWWIAECQELLAAPLDGNPINLVDWNMGALSMPTDANYWRQGRTSELALYVQQSLENLILNSGFEYNGSDSAWTTVFDDDFARLTQFPTINGANGGGIITIFANPFPGENSGISMVSTVGSPTGGNRAFTLNTNTFPNHGTVEFFIRPTYESNADSTNVRNIFSTTSVDATHNRLRVYHNSTGIVAVAYNSLGQSYVMTNTYIYHASSYTHIALQFDLTTGINQIYVNGTAGTLTSNNWAGSAASWGTSFLVGDDPYGVITGNGVSYASLRVSPVYEYQTTFTPTTAPLSSTDSYNFPMTFRNNDLWNQENHAVGLGWSFNAGVSFIYNDGSHLLINTNSGIEADIGSYWQDGSYTFIWGFNSINRSDDGITFGIHKSGGNFVSLEHDYGTVTFLSTYSGESGGSLYWRPNRMRDSNMTSGNILAWNSGGYFNVNSGGLTVTSDVSYVLTGQRSLHISGVGSPGQSNFTPLIQSLACNPGDTFHITGDAYVVSGTCVISMTDNANVTVFLDTSIIGQWQHIDGMFTSTKHNASVYVYTNGGDFWVDNLSVRRVPAIASFSPENYIPDGNIDCFAFVQYSPPFQFPSGVIVTYVTQYPHQLAPPVGTYMMQLQNSTVSTKTVAQAIYGLQPGTVHGTITAAPVYNASGNPTAGIVSGDVTAFPSGNKATFSAGFLSNQWTTTNWGPLTIGPNDTSIVLTFSVPPSQSYMVGQMTCSYTTNAESYVSTIVSKGQSYTASVYNGIDTVSMSLTTLNQHYGGLLIQAVGTLFIDRVTVQQQHLDSWNPFLYNSGIPSIIPAGHNCGIMYALDQNTSKSGKNSIAATVLFGDASTYKMTPRIRQLTGFSIPSGVGRMQFTARSIDQNQNPQMIIYTTPNITSQLFTIPSTGNWVTTQTVVANTTFAPYIDLISGPGQGTTWFDNVQLSNRGSNNPYFDTQMNQQNPPVVLSFYPNYVQPDSGTIMVWVNPQLDLASSSKTWSIFTINYPLPPFNRYVGVTWGSTPGCFNIVSSSDTTTIILGGKPRTYNLGDWIHVALTWDSSGTNLYINGALDIQGPPISIPSLNSLVLGSNAIDYTLYTTWANALFEKLYVLDRPMSVSEIQRAYLYADTEGMTITELQGLLEFCTGVLIHTFDDLKGNVTSYNVLMSEMPINNISGQLRFADVNIKLTETK